MYDIERQLNNLPKGKLSRKADLAIRLRIYFILLKTKLLPNRLPGGFFALKRAAVALVLVLFIFSATAVYAYESNEVTRGHALYGLKRAIERTELKLATSPVRKIKLNSNFAARRLAEAWTLSRRLAGGDGENLAQTIGEAGRQLAAAGELATGLDDRDQEAKQALEIVAGASSDQEATLGNLAQAVGADADEAVVDNIAVSLDRAKTEKRKVFQAIGRLDGDPVRDENAATGTLVFPEDNDALATATATQAMESLKSVEDRAAKLREKLSNGQVPPKDVDKFSKRLEGKLKKAKQAINDGKIDQARNLLETGRALANNGDRFFKNIKAENLKDDSQKNDQENKNSSRRKIEINKNLRFKEGTASGTAADAGKVEPKSEEAEKQTNPATTSNTAPSTNPENLIQPATGDRLEATTSQIRYPATDGDTREGSETDRDGNRY